MINSDENPIEYPIDGTLDLHQFAPSETKAATLEYIAVCLERRIMSIRIIGGGATVVDLIL